MKNEYNDGRPVLMGIVNEKPRRLSSKVSLHLYSTHQGGQVLEHDWKLVRSKSKKLLEAISKAPIRPEINNADFWNNRDFQSYLNPIGRQRALREIEDLKKSGWQIRTSRRKQDDMLIIDACNNLAALRFILPPEYPLNPPTVFVGDGEALRELKISRQWNSLYCLSDLASEMRSVLSCACCKRKAMAQPNQLSTIYVKEQ